MFFFLFLYLPTFIKITCNNCFQRHTSYICIDRQLLACRIYRMRFCTISSIFYTPTMYIKHSVIWIGVFSDCLLIPAFRIKLSLTYQVKQLFSSVVNTFIQAIIKTLKQFIRQTVWVLIIFSRYFWTTCQRLFISSHLYCMTLKPKESYRFWQISRTCLNSIRFRYPTLER